MRRALLTVLAACLAAGLWFICCRPRPSRTIEEAAARAGLVQVWEERGLARVVIWMRRPEEWTGEVPRRDRMPAGMLLAEWLGEEVNPDVRPVPALRLGNVCIYGDPEEVERLRDALGL